MAKETAIQEMLRGVEDRDLTAEIERRRDEKDKKEHQAWSRRMEVVQQIGEQLAELTEHSSSSHRQGDRCDREYDGCLRCFLLKVAKDGAGEARFDSDAAPGMLAYQDLHITLTHTVRKERPLV